MGGGADRVVGVEDGGDRALADVGAVDAGDDSLAGHVGEHLVAELGGIGTALADEAGIEPLAGDALELAEEVKPWLFTRVAPLLKDEVRGEFVEDLGGADVLRVDEVEVGALADDARLLRLCLLYTSDAADE